MTDGDHGPVLRSQVFGQQCEIDPSPRSIEDPFGGCHVYGEPAIGEERAGGVVRHQVHQALLHAREEPVPRDEVAMAEGVLRVRVAPPTAIGDA